MTTGALGQGVTYALVAAYLIILHHIRVQSNCQNIHNVMVCGLE